MPDYVQRQVRREEARDYLQARLRDGLTLARKVVDSLNLDAGRKKGTFYFLVDAGRLAG